MNDGAYTFKIKAGEDEMENVVIMKDDYSILPSFSAYISEIEDEKVKFSCNPCVPPPHEMLNGTPSCLSFSVSNPLGIISSNPLIT